MKVKRLLLVGLLLLSALQMAWATGDSEPTTDGNTVIKSYPFVAASRENLSYDVPQELTVNGKTYKLKDVRYEVTGHKAPVTVTKTVQVFDKASYDKEITETVDGTALRLVATTPVWHETPAATITKEYDRQGAVASELDRDGRTYTLQAVTVGTKHTELTVPAVFQTSNPYSDLFAFGGQTIELTDSAAPIWDGWEETVKAELGLNGSSYTLSGGRWDGDFRQQEDGSYTRTAIYTGTRETPVWTATYQSAPEYTAEITYTDSQYPNGVYEMEAVATYTYHSTLETILKVGTGVLVVALATACIVWLLRKKNKKNKDEESEE